MSDTKNTSASGPVIEGRPAPRPSDEWKPASSLPQPHRIAGFEHRYVRISVLGHADNTNVSQKMREGWVPVKAEDYPEIDSIPEVGGRFKGNIEYGGLLLCKIPTEQLDKRSEYYNRLAVQQMEAVDNNFMREEHPAMPLIKDRSSRTTFNPR
jgi:hypothetical protein